MNENIYDLLKRLSAFEVSDSSTPEHAAAAAMRLAQIKVESARLARLTADPNANVMALDNLVRHFGALLEGTPFSPAATEAG